MLAAMRSRTASARTAPPGKTNRITKRVVRSTKVPKAVVRGPTPLESSLDLQAELGRERQLARFGPPPPLGRRHVGLPSSIALSTPISPHLPGDRRRRPAQLARQSATGLSDSQTPRQLF